MLPDKISAAFDNKKFRIAFLSLIILVQIIYGTYVFAFEKMGFYTDEVWSYSYSNYFSDVFVYARDGYMGNFHDNGIVSEYIAVQPGERFNFSGVYKNSSGDLNPPLYYMLLHFICSFFPDKWSVVPAYIINVLSVIGTQIFLYLICRDIFREKKYLPFVCCIYYAVSRGALDTLIFLRMYAMLTFFTVMHIRYQFRVLHSSDIKETKKSILLSFISCYAGFMTQSFFPAVGGIMTFMVCLRLAFGKQFKKMFAHGFSMLGAVLLYAVTFPPGVLHVISSGSSAHTEGSEFPFVTQFRSMINFVLLPLTGRNISVFNTYTWIYVSVFLPVAAVLIGAAAFLLRKDPKFIKFRAAAAEKTKAFIRGKKYLGVISYEFAALAAVAAGYLAVAAKVINIMLMGLFAERYVMNLFPLFCIGVCMVAYRLFAAVRPLKKAAVPAAACAAAVLGMISQTNHSGFLIDDLGKHDDLAALFSGKKVEFVIGKPWESICFYPYLTECGSFRFIGYEDISADPEVIQCTGGDDGELYVAVPLSHYDISANVPNGTGSGSPNAVDGALPSEPDRALETFCGDGSVKSIEHICDFSAFVGPKTLYKITFD